MASWAEIAAEAPELAQRAREMFERGAHKTIATLRRDGSPRISGIEATFEDGELRFGSMPAARKADDLRRDPRFALHSPSEDPPGWGGDAKVAGRAVEIPSDGSSHQYRADITELSVVRVSDDREHLVIDIWKEGEGTRTIVRR